MTAIYVQAANPSIAVVGWMFTVTTIAVLIGPFLAWLSQAPRLSRLGVILLLAFLGGLGIAVAQTLCGVCSGCDPFWLEYFWVCL